MAGNDFDDLVLNGRLTLSFHFNCHYLYSNLCWVSKKPATKFTEKIVINCTQEFAFDYTQDYSNRLQWDSFLKKADLLDGATQADVGVQAYCVAKNGFGMITEYVSFNRPKAAAVTMIGGPYLFRTFMASWTFKQVAENQTAVIFLYSISLRFPFNLVAGMIRRNLQMNVRGRLIDLKKSIEQYNLYATQ